MDALAVISLDEAKAFLKIDFPDEDDTLTGIIKGAVDFVERWTGHYLFERDITLDVRSPYEVFQYPYKVKSLGAADATVEYATDAFSLWHRLRFNTGKQEPLVLTVGYATKEAIPPLLVEAVKKLVTYRYTHRDVYKAELPSDIQFDLQPYRRYASI